MKKKINFTLIIICIIIFTISILYNYYILKNKESFDDDFFTCTLQLDNIDPKFKNEYMKYNNQSVSCGVCKRAKLTVNVNTCPVDSNGTPIPNCNQKATLTNSFGNPIEFDMIVTPQNVRNFFCFG